MKESKLFIGYIEQTDPFSRKHDIYLIKDSARTDTLGTVVEGFESCIDEVKKILDTGRKFLLYFGEPDCFDEIDEKKKETLYSLVEKEE